jgi:hypothetical protein
MSSLRPLPLHRADFFNRIVTGGTQDPVRIVIMASRAHWRSGIRFNDLDFSDGNKYDRLEGYGQSKTANIIFANEIARRVLEKTILWLHTPFILEVGIDTREL